MTNRPNVTLEITPELDQAISLVCDLALKHAGVNAMNVVTTIVAALQNAAAASTAKETL